MLQLRALTESIQAEFDTGDLDADLRSLRAARAARSWVGRLDEYIRTDKPELMDTDVLDEAERWRVVRQLHWHNVVLGAYRRFRWELLPHIKRVQGPATVLELASGSGEFTAALARALHGLDVRVVGSDIVHSHVERARTRHPHVEFVVMDATAIDRHADVVFMAQAAHHFSPSLLGAMVRSALDRGATFLCIDGRRGPLLLSLLQLTSRLSLNPHFVHDSVVTSRKFYSEPELELIARRAAPQAQVQVRHAFPGYSVLTVSP